MHYFRIEANRWKTHLEKMKNAGLNTVSTYIPWSLHEQIEGKPDFKGKYAPNLNLVRFIELCAEKGLCLTVKPGPYILAELVMHGIPKWFFDKYSGAAALDPDGNPHPIQHTCLSHPDYRQKSMQWYDAVLPLLASCQATQGGPVSFMQVCNEVGLFQWLSGSGDYCPQSVADYQNYLRTQYSSIQELNSAYGSNYGTFDAVLPPAGRVQSKADHLAGKDWHSFHRHFYAEYIRWLIAEIRSRGIEIPLFHNVPG